MSTAVAPSPLPAEPPPARRVDYLNVSFGVRSWLLTTDHKRIAVLYLVVITILFFVGGAFATLIRLELVTPKGDLVEADTYNKLFTMHGVVMIFFFLIPSIPAVFGNFFVPMMVGAKDLAFPRLNLLSWYIFVLAAIVAIWAMTTGGVDTGWTFYTPYSTRSSHTYVLATGVAAFISGFSSILTGLNFVVTINRMRAPGLTWFRLPLFIWSMYATSIIILLGTPVVAVTLLMVAIEKATGIGIFDPALGGDPVLFQHLFWFYSHPAVYIMVLPSMGVVSELISTFTRKPVFGYKAVAFSSIAIAVIGFLVWGHHMFVSGQSVYAGLIFSF
ncbi:MAG TPA: cbb3-type cytochrome c oxidase subunit I, partial [Gemmataceae bacterium]|nr:cbb3-type cytochrome c oxidase subunit I [Gemmataceae bacterium]